MTYIIPAAGKGKFLQSITLNYPKTSYKLDENTSVIQRLVRGIRKYDKNAEIVVIVGYMFGNVKKELEDDNVIFVQNPFYDVTNSISSLWFAREYLERENVTILHGDMVFADSIMEKYIISDTDYPYVFIDKTANKEDSYNAMIKEDKIVTMSRGLVNSSVKYCGVIKLDPVSSRLLKREIDSMIQNNMYDLYWEDAMVQMIMFRRFELYYRDISNDEWAEVNSVEDLIHAQDIHKNSIGGNVR
ncbi:MAG: hypothetical protein IJJ59_09485 [Pseudobutyrivibrio sp.]|uniref:phosphocholine cytidylyltransferase family protein n=1 Tax=Pseudobutyrivibrio sp. TaxID=2014367 RepID=UPI0025E7A6C6|nr:NTP transferase domain-containing protein [Pseudobutyrivibrio sp.]MBQ6463541.1 hypothetical protein [Pseudobutyrivibrio sp.]MBQ8489523.1 hypothetical protein [Pseudobutyrivibrio sp.]